MPKVQGTVQANAVVSYKIHFVRSIRPGEASFAETPNHMLLHPQAEAARTRLSVKLD